MKPIHLSADDLEVIAERIRDLDKIPGLHGSLLVNIDDRDVGALIVTDSTATLFTWVM